MDLNRAKALAQRLMVEHGLLEPDWRFQWDQSRRRTGSCCFSHTQRFRFNRITLSRYIAEVNSAGTLRDAILHEIAHALAGFHHGHDDVWKEIALRIGSSASLYTKVKLPPPAAVKRRRDLRGADGGGL